MASPPPRLVYYSLFAGRWAAMAARQLVRSVESLRAHNRSIPVRVFVFGEIEAATRAALEGLGVTLEDAGDYQARLARFCPPHAAEVLARSPVLHYALSLSLVDAPPATCVLYLDSDTRFFGDVEALFERYRDLDVYAREEPGSRRSHLGYSPALIDEDALATLAAQEGARPVPPFNNGVLLFNHGAFRRVAAALGGLFDLVFRFSVGLALRPGAEKESDVVHLREHKARLVAPGDEARALACPTQNVWIKDEIALWLALGKIPEMRVGLFSRHDVLQGDEFKGVGLSTHLLAHYFTVNTERFDAWAAQRSAGPSASPAGGTSSDPTLRAVGELGARLEEAWRRVDFDERPFPALAAAALREARLERALSGLDVARWVLEAPGIPQQADLAARFGDPPITVFQGRRFYIQVLFWQEGRTAIHRHGFSGAFLVLDGCSLQVRYAFDERRRVSSRLLLGDLRPTSVELLARGDVVEIEGHLVHTVFHLEAPAATVVIRTFGEDLGQPQYSYQSPSLAHDPFHSEPQATRQLQVLRLLWETRPADGLELAAQLLARSDLHIAWLVLEAAQRALGADARAPLMDAARRRHGATIDELAAVLEEGGRRDDLGRLRRRTKDPGQRFFLALLQNVPHREGIEAMIGARYPDVEPRAQILAWLAALSGVDAIGVDLTDELNRRIVGALLDGRTPAGVLEALAEVFDPAQLEAQRDDLALHCDRIRATPLAPLFR